MSKQTPIILIIFISLFICLHALDFYTTWLGLRLGIAEKNPAMHLLTSKGTIWLLLIKTLGIIASLALLYVAWSLGSTIWRRTTFYALMAGVNLYLLYIVVQNTVKILRLINK